jgi:hypothetical protein
MTSAATSESQRQELAYRAGGGLDVSLLWRPADGSVAVVIADASGGMFELAVEPSDALAAFYHPFVFAARQGICHHMPTADCDEP